MPAGTGPGRRRIEPAAIIANLEPQPVGGEVEFYLHLPGLGMRRHVVQGLLHDPVEGYLRLAGDARWRSLDG